MEFDKINNLLGRPRDTLSKFITRNLIKVHDKSRRNYDDKRYSVAYVLVKRLITVSSQGNVIRDKQNRPPILKNNPPFISCISKINNELIENAEDLDIVIPMYDLLEYSKNYRKTTGSLFNYYRDELDDDFDDDNLNPNETVVESKSFKYKTSITGNTYELAPDAPGYDPAKEGTKETEIAVPLKYLGNFWRSLDMPLINCEVSLTLIWDKNCVITSEENR